MASQKDGSKKGKKRTAQNPAYILRRSRKDAEALRENAIIDAANIIQLARQDADKIDAEVQARERSLEYEVSLYLLEQDRLKLPFSLTAPLCDLTMWSNGPITKMGVLMLTGLGTHTCFARDERVGIVTVDGKSTPVQFGKNMEVHLLKLVETVGQNAIINISYEALE